MRVLSNTKTLDSAGTTARGRHKFLRISTIWLCIRDKICRCSSPFRSSKDIAIFLQKIRYHIGWKPTGFRSYSRNLEPVEIARTVKWIGPIGRIVMEVQNKGTSVAVLNALQDLPSGFLFLDLEFAIALAACQPRYPVRPYPTPSTEPRH
jgi:hypothetical protein